MYESRATPRTTLVTVSTLVALMSASVAGAVGAPVCPRWVCGSNSPVIDGAAIDGHPCHELPLASAVSAAGFQVTEVRRLSLAVSD